MIRGLAGLAALALATQATAQEQAQCQRELVVLGAGQDAGAPQIGNAGDTGPRLLPSSLALIDRSEGKRYLFDASPAITEQLAMLDAIEPPKESLGIDGVFLTHAHIGHYLGLAWLGREAAGAQGVPVYAMPRMAGFLRDNGPWSQLVELGNIEIAEMEPLLPMFLGDGSIVAGLPVPHRDEYSETVGFAVTHPRSGSFMYLPDIDGWEQWEMLAEDPFPGVIERFAHIFIDATFWDDNELPGRDMSEIPHPRVTATMELLADLPPDQRAKVHFIHYNHTNPIRDPDSPESKQVTERGFNVARGGQRFCLD